MDLLIAMVPLSLLLLGLAIWIFFWAVKSGQFDDMDSPAHRILFDDDDVHITKQNDRVTDKEHDSAPKVDTPAKDSE